MFRSLAKALWDRSKADRTLQDALARAFCLLGGNRARVRGTGNRIETHGAFLRRLRFDIDGTGNHVIIERGARVANLIVYMRGSGHKLVIGADCQIQAGAFWFEDRDCRILIGPHTSIVEARLAATEPNSRITIGQDCMFASGVEVRTGDSHSIIDAATGRRLNPAADVFIADHVWLAAHVIVLKNVAIGADTVVGTRSVVTRSLPGACLALGTPAKVARQNISWDRARL